MYTSIKLFCIAYPESKEITALLHRAASQRGVDVLEINPDTFNYTHYQEPTSGDLLYRVSAGIGRQRPALSVERTLLAQGVRTFYRTLADGLSASYARSHVTFQKAGVPIPKTINHVSNDKALLNDYVNAVGGLPVILKILGGSHGVGVMRIDTMPGLYSVMDFLSTGHTNILMRHYISARTHARLIVLGDAVIDSIEYTAPDDDFRTNVGSAPSVTPKTYGRAINQLAVSATRLLNLEFGGVDILLDQNNNPYITEVNFPCNFARAQNSTGTDIAGRMLDHLLNKPVT
jgi:ribosomal protein S6--L-glutamate ligase